MHEKTCLPLIFVLLIIERGEGGISPYHKKHHADLCWQIGTGYFGCRNPDGTFNPDMFAEKAKWDEVKVIELNLNPDDPSKGFIELDWNNDFVRYLKEHGYEGNDEEIVDEWLTELCRSIYANG